VSRALVTGVAGFIGSHLAERLLATGADVIGVDCFTPYYDPAIKRSNLRGVLDHDRFRLAELDLSTDDLTALPEVDEVFHLAAQAGVRASWGSEFEVYTRHNLVATQRLLEHYRLRPPRRVVYASSSSIYGDSERFPTAEGERPRPYSPYGVTKLAAEHLGLLYQRNFDLPVVALRFFTVYGPRQRPDMAFHRFIEAALAGRPLGVLGDGAQSRDFTFISDCVDGILRAKDHGVAGKVYNLGSGSPHTVAGVLELLAEILGGGLQMENLPSMPGDVRRTAADIDLARSELGYEPRTPLAEGLAAQVEWHRGRTERGVA
jgi:nucleoside-diphosphate-sugar epimerase